MRVCSMCTVELKSCFTLPFYLFSIPNSIYNLYVGLQL